MFELDGKYGTAKVFSDDFIQSAVSQIYGLLNTPLAEGSRIRVMPDYHAGAGCTIGLTMSIIDKVCPNLVGVDIGCGVIAAHILGVNSIDFEVLDKVIREQVPSGFATHKNASCSLPQKTSLHCRDYVDIDRAEKSAGTLGGGNHFIEVDKDSTGDFWLVIHTGSRKFGLDIARYYQKLATETCRTTGVPKALTYLEGENARNYLDDMSIAQKYAEMNRSYILRQICHGMKWLFDDVFETVHNYIDFEDNILRKGAVRADRNERLIIPMNMRDGSLLCKGKGNCDWNYSAPHGAGRLMSRSEAKQSIGLDDFKKSMEGIYTTCVTEGTIDESPMAYKPLDAITKYIYQTADVVDVLKPVYNFKAQD